ncbi:Csu type fimbrial protein [Rhodoferax saidenbachensis]|uniref:Spore coat protein U/FanG domain-containing protein n=1 Tax=Rhodoferax saidenbachensis TaxID=1484693 RepID=A0A1P8K8U7_9BURK|nr:spore coat protein U domain-containing protein [Rhodoferax saidenbachensis]APW42437.1 hypothetical protein RS694_07710 [Rhodoferax saidenbachensis]
MKDFQFLQIVRRQCWPLLLGLVLAAASTQAANACTASETGGTLTPASSQRVSGGPTITGSGTFAFNCGSTVLSVLGTPTLKATLQPSVSGLTLKNGANTIGYQIYSNAGVSTPYVGGAIVINLSGTTLLGVLNAGVGNTLPIYIATTPGANVPAGTYTDTVQVTWEYHNICEGLLGALGICVGVANNGTTVRNMTISLTVTNDCTINAPAVNFGSAPLVSGFGTVSQSISLLCSKGMTYTVGLSTGAYPANGRRRMASGANRLEYDIFKTDSTVWGNIGSARANGPAMADGVSLQTIGYTARVYQDQATPPVGSFADSVVVDVSF